MDRPGSNDPTHAQRALRTPRPPIRLQLIVFCGPQVTTHSLPPSGSVVIGRHDSCDIVIEDSTVSRKHAILHLGPPLRIENSGGTNGTLLHGEPLAPGQTVELRAGDVVDIGDSMIMLQPTATEERPRRMLPHSYFESRVEDECIRAEREGREFSVARLHIEGDVPVAVIEDALSSRLRKLDAIAAYAPGEYELLLADSDLDAAEAVLDDAIAALATIGLRISVGVANYPRDGRTEEALLARACEALGGEAPAAARAEAPSPAPATKPGEIVQGDAMKQLNRVIDRIAPSPISVLILGETGVGKEVMANRIHDRSDRAKKPFLGLNCAALSESLLESELFGHERGAFTGAVAAKPGLFESAHGGTVFLDEVGELPMAIQVKLLRVLETRQFMRVGGVKAMSFDVRFIAATNRDLEQEIEKGAFRQDLFFRLNGISFVIPALRERRSELPGLASLFIAQACRSFKRVDTPTLSAEALALFGEYHWPGNIRELKNVIDRAVLLCAGDSIELEHLPVEKMRIRVTRPSRAPSNSFDGAERTSLDAKAFVPSDLPSGGDERARILAALDQCAGNQTKAARVLGISRGTLLIRLDQYNIPRPRK